MRLLIALLVVFLLSAPTLANQTITGVASVIDGDTIEIHGHRIRLFGIDAPGSSQLCQKEGKSYRCGQEAAFALADKIGKQIVTCEEQDIDRYQRVVAICFAVGIDLNQWMTAQGEALAYRRYSMRYVADEEKGQGGTSGALGCCVPAALGLPA